MTRRPAVAALSHRLAALLALAGLAACSAPSEQWVPAEAPKTNKVELVRMNYAVRFAPGSATLAPGEAQRLADFLEDAEIGPRDRVLLAAPADALAPARAAALRGPLMKRGARPQALPAGDLPRAGQTPRADTASLVVERYVVTPPDCPNWSKPTGGDPTNSVGSNFGCANATNLGLMVADPRDLLIGRQPGPPDAEPALLAIQNYRAGKPVTLPDDLSGNATPGSSGAAPGASAGGGSGGAGTGK